MDHYRVACYALIASAFVLAGMLVTQLGQRLEPAAQAELVTTQNNVTAMTAATLSSEEALFVLDGNNGVLLVYSLDLGRERLELAGGTRLSSLFNSNSQNTGGGRGR